jgi:hypothetical protein
MLLSAGRRRLHRSGQARSGAFFFLATDSTIA